MISGGCGRWTGSGRASRSSSVVVLALEAERAVAPVSVVDDLELLLEHVHPLLHRQEREAVGACARPPTSRCPSPSSIAPAGHVVGGRGELGQHRRVAEARRRDHRAEPQRRRARGERVDRPPGVERAALALAHDGEVVVGAEERLDPERSQASASATQSSQVTSSWPSIISATLTSGSHTLSRRAALARLDSVRRLRARVVEHVGRHRGRAGGHRAVLRRRDPLRAGRARRARRGRAAAPPAAHRRRARRRSIGVLPFATSYGLIYWAEQYVTSGLTAVLFGVLPLYVALLAALVPARRAAAARGCCVGVGDRARRARARVRREPAPRRGRVHGARRGRGRRSRRSPARSATSRSRSAARARPAGDERLGDARSAACCCCAVSAPTEDWGATTWSLDVDRLDRLPGRVRHRLHVRDADRAAARAARGDRLVHLDDHPVRRAGARARCSATSR